MKTPLFLLQNRSFFTPVVIAIRTCLLIATAFIYFRTFLLVTLRSPHN